MLADTSGTAGNVGLTDAAAAPPVAWPGFRPVRVVAVNAETDTVTSIRLGSDDGSPLPPALPGQFIVMRLLLGDSGAPATRSYSLSSAPGSPEYRISVKREPGGAVSGFVQTHLKAGASVEIAAPRGGFILRDGAGPALLISAGIGCTPVLAILAALAANKSDRQIRWLHGARNSAEHPFVDEVRGLIAQLPNGRDRDLLQRTATGGRSRR